MSIPGIEGVTLSGGDPFDQPGASLLAFLHRIRQRSPLSVMCYTGRTLRALQTGPDADLNEQLLACIDILVDGPYVEALNRGHKWRGSSNQEIHFLTDRDRGLEGHLAEALDRSLEFELALDNTLTISGIPGPGFLDRLRGHLAARRVALRIAEG